MNLQLQEFQMVNRGSEWGRWDLHVHTKGTAKNDGYTNISFDEYCDHLFKKAIEHNIYVIGITDYFNIENYKLVKAYQNNITSNENFNDVEKAIVERIMLMPNVELRITPSTDKGSLINIHLIIDPRYIEEYEEQFSRKLIFTYSNSHEYSLCKLDLIRLGKVAEDNTQLDDKSAMKAGVSNFVLNPADLIKAFKELPDFRSKCIVGVSNSNKDGASSFQGHEKFLNDSENSSIRMLRESIYKLSDVIFSANEKDIDFFNGVSGLLPEKYGECKPCVHGSDAHSLDKIFNPDLNRYCWIKAEPTFEGLKQILYEPVTRIFIGHSKPETKLDYEVIESIRINDINIGNEIIYLNSNLNTIVGGRSSGKSTLIQCIAHKIAPKSLENIECNSHIPDLSKNINIIWQDGKEDDARSIEYFYQGHMYNKSQEEGIEDIIKDILLQSNPDAFASSDSRVANLKQVNASKLSSYFTNKEKSNHINDRAKNIGKKEDIQEQIVKLNQDINTSSIGSLTPEDLEKHELKKEKLGKLERGLEQLTLTDIQISSFEVENFINNTDYFVDNIFYRYFGEILEAKLGSIDEFARAQIIDFKKEANEALETVRTRITDNQNLIVTDDIFISREKYLKDAELIKPLLDQKESENQKLKNILAFDEEIMTIENESKQLLVEVRKNWQEMNDEPIELIKQINVLEDSNLEVTPKSSFENVKFSDFIKKSINLQSDKAQSYTTVKELTTYDLLQIFDEIILSIRDNSIRLKAGFTEETFTKEFLTNVWFRLSYDVIYEGDNYNIMSQGKKAFVVLKLSLECSDKRCPIIIDQPEDDLDNRAIYTELVTYIKEKKADRQIILVTHNANVVVNADSEQIIIANQNGAKNLNKDNKKFEYKFGSIESSLKSDSPDAFTLDSRTIKEHICEILEGGDTAFKLREKKYDI